MSSQGPRQGVQWNGMVVKTQPPWHRNNTEVGLLKKKKIQTVETSMGTERACWKSKRSWPVYLQSKE